MLLLCHFPSGFRECMSAAGIFFSSSFSSSSLLPTLNACVTACQLLFLRASSPGNPGQRPQFDSAVWTSSFESPASKNTASISTARRPAGILPAGRCRISPGGTFLEPQKEAEGRKEGRKEVGFHTLPLAPAAFSTYACFFHYSFAHLQKCKTLMRYRERWTVPPRNFPHGNVFKSRHEQTTAGGQTQPVVVSKPAQRT